jgi:hypothetical protein
MHFLSTTVGKDTQMESENSLASWRLETGDTVISEQLYLQPYIYLYPINNFK